MTILIANNQTIISNIDETIEDDIDDRQHSVDNFGNYYFRVLEDLASVVKFGVLIGIVLFI